MLNQETEIPHKMLVEWRSSGFISGEEIAFRSGDLIVAENVITKVRRIINPTITESSSNKRVLKG
jgi:hypothetical protein|tara:strand:+ start:1359 stop:1553 length:195 start_codon:yes stop_codon:yes gene_type:complete